jgi:hypothetical protein
MRKIIYLSILSLSLLLTNCASFYHAVHPDKISYPPTVNITDKLDLTYRYDVLKDAGNKKFVNSERKRNLKIVAVKLTNNSDTTINISKDVSFYCGGSKIALLSPIETKSKIQQSWPAYGLYLIGCISLAPLDILIFGGIGAGNMIVAADANKKLLTELTKYDITNKELKKGESVIGLIGFEALHADPLTVKLN